MPIDLHPPRAGRQQPPGNGQQTTLQYLSTTTDQDMAVPPQGCVPAPYQPRRPADTPLYRVVQNHLETYLALCHDDWEEERVSPHAERELRRYLECGILAYGFARARCDDCGHDFLIAFSCKGRGVCPSCNTRRMAQTAAHLVDHVLPRLPVRQWVLSVPKRLRYHLQHDREVLNSALRIFLDAVERHLRARCPGAGPKARVGAVAFIHRFGSSLNQHTHFHVCVIDGVFEPGPEQGVRFIEVEELDADDAEAVQTQSRRRILRAFARRGLLEKEDRKEMEQWDHGGGFSLDASVRIEAHDRQGLERLLRYCARPPAARRPTGGDRRPAPYLPPPQALPRWANRPHPLSAGTYRPHRRTGPAAPATSASLLRRTCTQLAPASGGHRPSAYTGGNRARAGRSACRRDGGR